MDCTQKILPRMFWWHSDENDDENPFIHSCLARCLHRHKIRLYNVWHAGNTRENLKYQFDLPSTAKKLMITACR